MVFLESKQHKKLKEIAKNHFKIKGYVVFEECKFNSKRIDIYGVKGDNFVFCECIVTQGLGEVIDRLIKLREENRNIKAEYYIFRFFKNKTPLTRKMLKIVNLRIKLIEINREDINDDFRWN